MNKATDIVRDDEIEKVFENTRFGNTPKRKIIDEGVLKCACGYRCGHTAESILIEMGLVNRNWTLTKKGKEYLWEVYYKP